MKGQSYQASISFSRESSIQESDNRGVYSDMGQTYTSYSSILYANDEVCDVEASF